MPRLCLHAQGLAIDKSLLCAAMPDMPKMPVMDLQWRDSDLGLGRLDSDLLPDV